MGLPKIRDGHKRTYIRCKTCECCYYYDYVPYSLSSGITAMPCGHDIGRYTREAVEKITRGEFDAGKKHREPEHA